MFPIGLRSLYVHYILVITSVVPLYLWQGILSHLDEVYASDPTFSSYGLYQLLVVPTVINSITLTMLSVTLRFQSRHVNYKLSHCIQ